MTLSYHLGYLETILVHPTRRQSFAGKTDSTFYNIRDLVISCLLFGHCLPAIEVLWTTMYSLTRYNSGYAEKQNNLSSQLQSCGMNLITPSSGRPIAFISPSLRYSH